MYTGEDRTPLSGSSGVQSRQDKTRIGLKLDISKGE